MLKMKFLVLVLCLLSAMHRLDCHESGSVSQQPELTKLVRNWSEKIGGELWHLGELVTRKKTVTESFKQYRVEREDGEALLKEIADKIKRMMDDKVSAVNRIMEVAENKAVTQGDNVESSYDFYNAKNLTNSAPNATAEDQRDAEMGEPQVGAVRGYEDLFSATGRDGGKLRNMVQPEESDGYQGDQDQNQSTDENFSEDELPRSNPDIEIGDGSEQDPLASQAPPADKRRLPLKRSANFYNTLVNLNYSVVHVPSNVYERSKEVIRGIKWSEELDKTFRNNYNEDPTLSWQYFGSATGFMRQFPGLIWEQEPTDVFDCRMRPWFVEAASSPKDVVILVDRSGSMTGMRREIARHVVNNILETLGNNDYVNIYTFSNTTDALVDCFDNMLVQANLANIRLLKDTMASFKTEQIANFSLALTTAFEVLKQYREKGLGAGCNQAIMLITDGVQYNYIEVFKEYNWMNLPFMPVRVFTYLIGREVSDVREIKWMACANRGYYVHLSTYSEVREQVLQYIPVMARPMVLNPKDKPRPAWSPIYADVADPKLTNWFWTTRQRERQRNRFLQYRKNKTLPEQDKKFEYEMNWNQDSSVNLENFRLMTSVSLPVYDKRPSANITENIQINEAIWISVTRETRVANLLGVAGTDVPIEYIKQLMLPYRLGVNAYAFIVTNNGYILIHPDFRPVFQGILKPAYNRVDVVEVEIMDDDNDARNFNEELLKLRDKIVMQHKSNGSHVFNMKLHLDQKRRIFKQTRHFYFTGLENTPFSLVLSIPQRYGLNKAQIPIGSDMSRLRANNIDLKQYFTGNWNLHPEWHYCRYLDRKEIFDSPEEELLHFIEKMLEPGWKWTDACDRKLVIKTIADAEATKWFNENISPTKDEQELITRFGITVAFLATHSGLTRWQYFSQNVTDRDVKERPHFHQLHNRAIDEVWYRRAVEQYYLEERSFVYSVPFDVGDDNSTLVTASHAIFREESAIKAPVAVVGFQFKHTALYETFNRITNKCENEIKCKRTCNSSELHCLLLDDNGYVIVSDNREETGKFFGLLRADIMDQLIRDGIYTQNRIFDYQATCDQPIDVGNPASHFSNPLTHVSDLLHWALGTVVYFAGSVWGNGDVLANYSEQPEDEEQEEPTNQPPTRVNEKEFDQRLLIQKTKPEPCDKEIYIYTLTHFTSRNISKSRYNETMSTDCTRPFVIQPVVSSNMVLLVINNICPQTEVEVSHIPAQVDYNMTFECYRVMNNNYSRRHYMSCINRSPKEPEIKLCGRGTSVSSSVLLATMLTLVLVTII